MRVFIIKLRVKIEIEMRVFRETLNFEIEMRLSQKSAGHAFSYHILNTVLKRAILGDLRRAGNSGQLVAIDF